MELFAALQNTPLHPIAERGRQRLGGADVAAERRLAKLENTLTLIKLDPAENVPLLAPLLDMPLPNEHVVPLAPEELPRRQFGVLTSWTIASAKVQPVVLAFEDLHWADPTTLDLLRGFAERGALLPCEVPKIATITGHSLADSRPSLTHITPAGQPSSRCQQSPNWSVLREPMVIPNDADSTFPMSADHRLICDRG